MDSDANTIAVGRVSFRPIDIALEHFRVGLLDILRSNNHLNLK